MQKIFRNLAYFQAKIWDNQLSAVFYDLFNSGLMSISSSAVKDACLQVCTVSITRNHKIGQESLDDVLTNAAYQNARTPGGEAMKEVFRKLWRLCLLVRVLHDVAYLLNSSFASTSQIADTARTAFVSAMNQYSMQEENAIAIHNHSMTIELRNEQQGKSNKGDPVFGKSPRGGSLDNDSRKLSLNRDLLASALNIQDEYWTAIKRAGLDVDHVLYIPVSDPVVGRETSPYGDSTQRLVDYVSTVLKGLIALNNDFPSAEAMRASSLMFDPAQAVRVTDFIEVYRNGRVVCFSQNESEAQTKFLSRSQPSESTEEVAVALEAQTVERLLLFLQGFVPALKIRLASEMILEATRPFFSGIDLSVVQVLLSEAIRRSDRNEPAMQALNNLLASNDAAVKAIPVQAYFTPPSTHHPPTSTE
ncbi:MAG: hypothetical protein Q9166_008006 [cf. Caloplaca sp. 2 TL-2023]